MRVSDDMINRTLLNYLQQGRESVLNLQSQISSGLRVQKPSDDPGAYSLIRLHQTAYASAQQFQVNANRTEGRLGIIDGKLQQLSNLVQRVSEVVVAGSDSTKPPVDRQTMGEEVNHSLEDAVSLANTAYEGEYIFAGLKGDTPPYSVTRDSNGQITAVTCNGNQGTRFVEIGDGVYVPANLPGSDTTSAQGVFQSSTTDLFANLINIRDRLQAGNNLAAEEDVTAEAGGTIAVNSSYATGSSVRLSTTGTLPTGLNANTDYYVIRVSGTQIRLAATLADARNGVAIGFTNDGTGQLAMAQQSLADITREADHTSAILARVGAYLERVTLARKILAADVLSSTQGIDREGSVDTAKAVTELAGRQTTYEAALAVTARMMNVSLLNYM